MSCLWWGPGSEELRAASGSLDHQPETEALVPAACEPHNSSCDHMSLKVNPSPLMGLQPWPMPWLQLCRGPSCATKYAPCIWCLTIWPLKRESTAHLTQNSFNSSAQSRPGLIPLCSSFIADQAWHGFWIRETCASFSLIYHCTASNELFNLHQSQLLHL